MPYLGYAQFLLFSPSITALLTAVDLLSAQLSRHTEIRTIWCLAASRSAFLYTSFCFKSCVTTRQLSTETSPFSGNTALSYGTREKEIVGMLFFIVRVMSIFGRVAIATDYPKLIARLGTHI